MEDEQGFGELLQKAFSLIKHLKLNSVYLHFFQLKLFGGSSADEIDNPVAISSLFLTSGESL